MKKERSRMTRKASRRNFRQNSKPHPLNSAQPTGTMRGGIRL